MKLNQIRKELKNDFISTNIEEEDVDFIISEILHVKRTSLSLIDDINEVEEKEIREKCEIRKQGLSVDKIFQKAYFFGLEFKVDKNVLSPRPESEMLVEKAIEYINNNDLKNVLDLCTGSGCLAVAIKKNCDINITATDISQKALAIAKQNANIHDVEINFIRSNMFEKIEECFDLIVSNPPYIDSDEVKTLDKEVLLSDPHLALDGGEMGLKFYNIIHDNLRKYLNNDGILIMEIGDEQKDMLISLFNDFDLVESLKDLSGNDRVLIFKK